MSTMPGLTNAIRAVLGPCPNMDVNTSVSLTYAKTVNTGPTEVYYLGLVASSSIAATFSLIDATASGTADTVIWQTQSIPSNLMSCNFTRPLKFSKGLQITYSATGAANVTSNVQWSPIAGSQSR